MKCIIAEFILDKQKEHEAAGDAYSKPHNVNERKQFLFSEILYGE